jgi:hypothetical protein
MAAGLCNAAFDLSLGNRAPDQKNFEHKTLSQAFRQWSAAAKIKPSPNCLGVLILSGNEETCALHMQL